MQEHTDQCVCVCVWWMEERRVENDLDVRIQLLGQGDSDIISLSLSLSLLCPSFFPSCLYTVHFFLTLKISIALVLAASLSITASYNDFSPMLMYIPSLPPLTSLSLLHSLFVSLSLNFVSTAVRSKQGVLKLLIIIPWHEMVGRLGGGHIAAKVLQHTKWAEQTEPRPQGSGQPQNGSIMENGSWGGGRHWLPQRPREVDTSLTGNQQPEGREVFHGLYPTLSAFIPYSRKFITAVKLIVLLWISSLNTRETQRLHIIPVWIQLLRLHLLVRQRTLLLFWRFKNVTFIPISSECLSFERSVPITPHHLTAGNQNDPPSSFVKKVRGLIYKNDLRIIHKLNLNLKITANSSLVLNA